MVLAYVDHFWLVRREVANLTVEIRCIFAEALAMQVTVKGGENGGARFTVFSMQLKQIT